MPRVCADRVIMFMVIGLVAWTIIGLPIFISLEQAPPNYQAQPAQSEEQRAPRQEDAEFAGGPLGAAQAEQNTKSTNQHGHWYGTFIEHPAEWVTAIFTVMLAIYTRGLFKATRGAPGRDPGAG